MYGLKKGAKVTGPDPDGVQTEWTVMFAGPMVTRFIEGYGPERTENNVVWLSAEDKDPICVSDRVFMREHERDVPAYEEVFK